jgi:restriction system protein
MAIPDYQSLMLPLLQLAADGQEHALRDAVEAVSDRLGLSEAQRAELLPSGTARVIASRIGWARTYLKQAGLLDSPRRGVLCITPAGRALLSRNPARVDNTVLEHYESFRAFRARSKPDDSPERVNVAGEIPQPEQTPEDAMAQAYERVRTQLEAELLEQVKASSPSFFERLVVDLLVAMGYGGSRQDAGRALGKSGDGGIDGIIKEDRLGLDVIYLQAKRWEGVVGRPEIQKFAGALQGQRASKGVFITTSGYSKEAIDFAQAISSKIILIDGATLSRLMVDFNVGVSRLGTYELKRIDTDYFDES